MKKVFKIISMAVTAVATMSALTACDASNACTYDESSHKLFCSEKTYSTTNVKGQIWMAENLSAYIPDSSVCYGNDHANCDTMGRLYTWGAATNGLCPKGWELPSQQDFKNAFGNAVPAELKKDRPFGLLFAGFRYFDGKFADKNASASFWTRDSYDDSRAYLVRVTDSTIAYEHFNKNIAASVRCVKN